MTFAPFSQEGEGPGGKLAKTLRARSHEHKPTGRRWQLGSPPAEASRAAAGLFDIKRPQLPSRPIAKAPPRVRRLPALGVWCSQVIGPLFRPKAAATLSRSDGLGVHRPRTMARTRWSSNPVLPASCLWSIPCSLQRSATLFRVPIVPSSPGEAGNNLSVPSANLYNVEGNNRISESPPHAVRAAPRASLHAPDDAGPRETAPWPSSPAGVVPTAPSVTLPLGHAARFAVPRLLIPKSLSRGSTSCGPDRSDHRHRGCRG
jgi:hypothetical protein